MKRIATMGGLKKHFTNHSVRKTTARKLQKAGMSNDKIISITGHKTEQRIKAYVDTDLEDHRYISTLLSNQRPQVENACWLMHNPGMNHIPLLVLQLQRLLWEHMQFIADQYPSQYHVCCTA